MGSTRGHGLRAALALAALLLPVPAAAAAGPWDRERTLEADGKWTEAVAAWRRAVDKDAADRDAWRGYLLVLETSGRNEDLAREAGRAVERFPGWVEGSVRQARALAALGRGDEALEVLRRPAESSMVAAAELGRLLEERGRRKEAAAAWAGVIRRYDGNRRFTPDELYAAGVAARGTGDFHGAARLFELAYSDSLDFLPARLALARLFHQKYQAQLAGTEIGDARTLAPRHPDVLLAQAELALLNKQLPGAEMLARAVLAVRDGDAAARRVLARLDLVAERPDLARRNLEPVLAVNRLDREAHALMAAAAYMAGDSAAWHGGVNGLLDDDPLYVNVFLILGDVLELLLRNDEASAMYRRVVALDPTNAEAWAALGHIAMREGREAEGHALLETAFEHDRFNIRAFNQLELLDFMEKFSAYPEPRFTFRLLAAEDSVLLPLLTERFDAIWEDLTARHGWRPETPTVVEIFPEHAWFSARVTGLAWVEGIPGVCFGDVIAMDSPRTLAGATNWEQVLRHEFGHVLALGMTRRQVPFWFTEGLSVFLETHPRGRVWDEVLVGAWWDGGIVSVDSLTIAFTRPKHREQRLLAYHQAGLIIDDIVARHGWEAIPALLRAFGEGRTLREAVPEILGTSWEAFGGRAREVALARAMSAGLWPPVDPERIDTLRERLAARPGDPVLLERLAVAQVQAGRFDDAAATAASLGGEGGGNPLALGVLGLAAKAADDAGRARELLTRSVDAGVRDLPIHLALAEVVVAAGDTAEALRRFEGALAAYPRASEALGALARLTLAGGDSAAARGWLRRLIATDDGAGGAAVDLARLDLARRDGRAAEEALHFASSVLPRRPDVLALRGQACLLLDRDREAFDLFAEARRIDLRDVDSMIGMARYYLKTADPEEAEYFAGLALKYDPGNAAAREILDQARRAW